MNKDKKEKLGYFVIYVQNETVHAVEKKYFVIFTFYRVYVRVHVRVILV